MTRDQIVNLYNQRKRMQECFTEEHNGIICPIRAKIYKCKSTKLDLEDPRLSVPARDIANLFARYGTYIMSDPEDYRDFKEETSIVGYFTASRMAGTPVLGYSLCSLQDDFNKDIGLLLAMAPISVKIDGEEQYVPVKDALDIFRKTGDAWLKKRIEQSHDVHGNLIICAWPFLLVDQLKRFIDKCKHYYKDAN